MNTAALNALAETILAAQTTDRSPMGIAFAIASAGQHLTPETTAELARLRARMIDLETGLPIMQDALLWALDRVAELEAERHTTNEVLSDAAERLRRDRDRIAELEALTPAEYQTCRRCSAAYRYGNACSNCAFQAEIAAAAARECGCPARPERHAWGCPTLPAEDSYVSPLHHDYRLGHDIPEAPHA